MSQDQEVRRRYFRRKLEIMEYNAAIQTAHESGLAEGIAKAKLEGWVESQRDGAATILKIQLKQKFGTLPDWVEAKLDSLSIEQLERLCEPVLFVNNLNEIFLEF